RGTTIQGGIVGASIDAGLYPNNTQATFDFEGTTTNNVASELQVDANVSSNSGQYVYYLNSVSLRTVNVHGQSVGYGGVLYGNVAASGGPWSITNGSITTIAMSSASPPGWWHAGMSVYDQNTGNTIGTTQSWSNGNLVVTGSGAYSVSNNDVLFFDAAAGNRYYAYVNTPNANVNFNGVNLYPAMSSTTGVQWRGVQLISAKTFQWTNNSCRSVYYCLDWTGFTSGTALISGNTSYGSTSTTTNNGANSTSVAWGPNVWDKGDVPPWPLIVTNAASPYSFTVPVGAPLIDVWGIGAGGGGGAMQAAGAACSGGSGGGAGVSIFSEFTAAELGGAGATLTVTVPAGGLGGAGATVTGPGSAGSVTSGTAFFGAIRSATSAARARAASSRRTPVAAEARASSAAATADRRAQPAAVRSAAPMAASARLAAARPAPAAAAVARAAQTAQPGYKAEIRRVARPAAARAAAFRPVTWPSQAATAARGSSASRRPQALSEPTAPTASIRRAPVPADDRSTSALAAAAQGAAAARAAQPQVKAARAASAQAVAEAAAARTAARPAQAATAVLRR
ncbi:MAG: hypothetical protein JOY66_11735, partial [Acetobacteraceae bacterium]|nr:hypothetical protein [Acetobacteraceae bacterium]